VNKKNKGNKEEKKIRKRKGRRFVILRRSAGLLGGEHEQTVLYIFQDPF
jgi:hypothetical protein